MFLVDLYLIFIRSLVLIFSLLVGIAFLTLLERKVLGYIQIRKGPNKVGLIGLVQPFRDALKLLSKEQIYPLISNYFIYYVSPIFRLTLSLFIWFCLPFFSFFLHFNFRFLFLLCISRLRVYTIILAGWSSNSNYSLLGGLRCVAQTISYEVRLSIILISVLFLISRLNILDLIIYQNYIWFICLFLPLSIIIIVSLLAETNRTPFDFSERESELVSGFNIEYRRGSFTLIFISEYCNILFIRIIFSFLFLGGSLINLEFFFLVNFIIFFFIWVRGTLPRFRYDKLIYLTWKLFLPLSLNYLVFFIGIYFYLINFI